jgi:hypothetical protein
LQSLNHLKAIIEEIRKKPETISNLVAENIVDKELPSGIMLKRYSSRCLS